MLNDLSPLVPFLSSKTDVKVPAHSMEVMELCLLDWAICGLGAQKDPILRSMARHASHAAGGTSSVFHTKDMVEPGAHPRAPARAAALINGTISHALDFDDTHFAHIGHVSTVVIPAALAVAEAEGHGFETFLRAARIGAEVATRVGLWLGRSHYQAGWHQTATSGAFGAAAASAVLLGAPTMSSLLNAAGFAAGQKAQFGSAMKPVNAGMAAANGVEAAQLAKVDLSGSPDVFAALLATHAGEGDVTAFDGLGDEWLFDTVSHKYHACCHGTHAMIEALLSLDLPRGALIDRIDVRTSPRWLSVCNKPDPDTWLEGKFSYRFLCALILDGARTIDPEPDVYFPRSEAITAMMERVNVIEDSGMNETETQITVALTSGDVLQASHDLAAPEPLALRRKKLMQKGGALLMNGVTGEIEEAIAARDLAAFTRVIRRID
jgi:2-methylcitrate dehydratase PrpD